MIAGLINRREGRGAEMTREEIEKIVDAELERRRETQGLPYKWKLESLGWMAVIVLGLLSVAGFAFNDWVAGKVKANMQSAVEVEAAKVAPQVSLEVARILSVTPSFVESVGNRVLFPPGAVIAFASECPNGWSLFGPGRDRFLLGAGEEYTLLSRGGTSTHALTANEIPPHPHPHTHQVLRSSDESGVNTDPLGWPSVHGDLHGTETGVALGAVPPGSALPHNNMPPYIAVNFCKKEAG